MTRVVLINDMAKAYGGQTGVVITTALGLAERGYDVVLFAGSGEVDDELRRPGITVHTLDQGPVLDDPNRVSAMKRGISNPVARQTLDRIVAGCGPDTIFHVNGWLRILSPSIFQSLRHVRDRTIITMHDHFTFCPNGGYYNYRSRNTCSVESMSFGCLRSNCDSRSYSHKLWRFARHAAARHIGRFPGRFRHFIVFGDAHERFVRGHLGGDAVFHQAPNPVPVERGGRVAAEDNTDIVFIGRMTPEKAPVLFAECARAAAVKAVFVGDGREADQVRAANDEAEITGWVSRSEVMARLARARALVFSSRWPETFGLVLFEAISKGIPVVISPNALMFEKAVSYGAAIPFDVTDPTTLTAALRSTADDARIAEISRTAHERYWQSPLSLDGYLDRLTSIYRRLLPAAA